MNLTQQLGDFHVNLESLIFNIKSDMVSPFDHLVRAVFVYPVLLHGHYFQNSFFFFWKYLFLVNIVFKGNYLLYVLSHWLKFCNRNEKKIYKSFIDLIFIGCNFVKGKILQSRKPCKHSIASISYKLTILVGNCLPSLTRLFLLKCSKLEYIVAKREE